MSLRKLSLKNVKVEVLMCSKPQEWETGEKSGVYYQVCILVPEFSDMPITVTSDYEIKKGSLSLNFQVLPKSDRVIKLKVRKDEQEATEIKK